MIFLEMKRYDAQKTKIRGTDIRDDLVRKDKDIFGRNK